MPDFATNPAPLTRDDLYKAFPNQPKVVRAFEQLFRLNATTTDTLTSTTSATKALVDATVVTLSPNDAFSNERVLSVDPQALTLTDRGAGADVLLALVNLITKTAGKSLAFTLAADTALSLPASGRVVALAPGAVTYASDADAAVGGVAVGDIYRKSGGVLAWRQV